VVVKPNYQYVPNLSKLLVELNVDQYQFAFVHAIGNAGLYFDKMVPYVSLASVYIKKGLQIGIDSGRKVMAEAMPYCVMQGFERYVSELYIPETEIFEGGQIKKNFDVLRKTDGKGLFNQCLKCRFRLICEGPWKEYPMHRGDLEFSPVFGKLISSTNELLSDELEFPINPESNFGIRVYANNFRNAYVKK
jgi:hypothetical protein